ncbi:MAG: hypothetical protein MR740_01705 [Clostridium sp.]|nr:hypothetical protein [Clostridium sp.]
MSALAAEWDISKGDITVNAGSGGQTVTQGGGAAVEDSPPVIMGSSTDNTLTINAEKDQTASVTLSGVNIDVSGAGKAAVSTTGAGNVSIELDGDSTLMSGEDHAGLEKNNGGSLIIADQDENGKLTAEGGKYGAGIGGGIHRDGSDIAISGGEVKATGGLGGAGIGGGPEGNGNNIAVSGAAKLKMQGGIGDSYSGEGAGIGDGCNDSDGSGIPGAEVEPDICALKPGGKIEYYAPGSGMTGTPSKTITNPTGDHVWDDGVVTKPATCTEKGVRTYTCTKDPSHKKSEDIPVLGHSFDGQEYVSNNDATYESDGTKTAKCVRYDQCGETHTIPDEESRLKRPEQPKPAPLYRVTDRDGRDIAYTAEQTGGMLTVTVDADFAILTGRLSGIRTLKAQGVEKLVFVTKGATSAFLLSDLLDKGGEAYWLTHDDKAVAFTLGENMASILTKP